MKCPVCPLTELPEDAVRCPGCGTDLAAYRRLHELGATQFNDALALVSRGELEAALEKLRAAVAVDARPARVRALAGKVLWKLGRFEEAIDEWTRAAAESPDDKELARLLAAGRAKDRRRRRGRRTTRGLVRIGAVAAALLLAAVSAWTAVESTAQERETLEGRVARLERQRGDAQRQQAAVEERLDDATARATSLAAALDAYRSTHRHGDEEFQTAVDSARSAASRLREETQAKALLRRRLDDERRRAEEAERRNSQLTDRLANAQRRAEDSAQQARLADETAGSRQAWVEDTLLPLLETMKPRRADTLRELIEQSRDEVAALQRQESELRRKPVLFVTDLRLAGVRKAMNLASMRLTLAETEYQDCVVPWEQAVARVRAAAAGWRGEASP